jgi:hypothetical protein
MVSNFLKNKRYNELLIFALPLKGHGILFKKLQKANLFLKKNLSNFAIK